MGFLLWGPPAARGHLRPWPTGLREGGGGGGSWPAPRPPPCSPSEPDWGRRLGPVAVAAAAAAGCPSVGSVGGGGSVDLHRH